MMSNSPDWNGHRAFLAVLETGSLSAAARLLDLSQPTVRARVAALEEALGTVLFIRSVHGLMPTLRATAMAAPVRAMAHAAEAMQRAASADSMVPAGRVRLSVSEFVGVEVLRPMLRRLHDRHPDLVVEYELSNSSADLLQQQVDVAVRMHSPQQDALIARKVPPIRLGLFATRDYIARRGHPASRAEILDHLFIGADRSAANLLFVERIADGRPIRTSVHTDSHVALLALARAGLGIAVVMVPIAARDPQLVQVFPDIDLPALDPWIVVHENLRHLPRVGALFDHMVEEFDAFASSAG